jgi:hypothetical protein
MSPVTDARSEQRLAVGGGSRQAPAGSPGGGAGLERGLDGGGNEFNNPRVPLVFPSFLVR